MKKLSMVLMLLFLCVCMFNIVVYASDISFDEFLIQTGMPQSEIDKLDLDIKEYMVNSLRNNVNSSDLDYVDIDVVPTRVGKVNQVLSGISFSASAFKGGSTIYIYPTYEFTQDIKPDGQDSFSFQLGDAMVPYNYGAI